MAIFSSMEKNRAVKGMAEINAIVDWSRIENLLMENYPVGKIAEVNRAYPPILLMKCLLLRNYSNLSWGNGKMFKALTTDADLPLPSFGRPAFHSGPIW